MTYPALYVEALRRAFPLNGASTSVGRDGDIQIPDTTCSRKQFMIRVEDGRAVLQQLSESVPTLHNGAQINGSIVLQHGDSICAGSTTFRFLECEEQPAPQKTIVGHFDTERSLLANEIPIAGSGFIGRDADKATYILDHLRVSRRHAELRVLGDVVHLRDAGSSNGTFLNGERIAGWRQLRAGDRIDIGPFSVAFTGRSFVQSTREGNLRIVAQGLTRTVGAMKILDDVSIVIEPNEFVCILGSSGSGKSTLMHALSARRPANAGRIVINDEDLYTNFEAMKQSIALVPQKDVLHEGLSLEEALSYTARLRLPPDTNESGIAEAVKAAIARVDLSHRASTPIANLSGGQKKRASLANETVARPNLLFLDEVTSGLDEGTDWEMMRLFRRMADDGITVVCVTHTVANVEDFCHKMIVMTNPGVLAFYGTPAEARAHFGIAKLGDLYRKLAEQTGDVWQQRYRSSREYARYIGGPLHSAVLPEPTPAPHRDVATELKRMWPEIKRQFPIVAGRYAKLVMADRQTLAIAALQSATIGAFLVMIYGKVGPSDPKMFSLAFFLGISCFWYGCNNASKEIVKESSVYRLERDVNLSVPAYVMSKMAVLTVLGAAQVIVLFAIVHNFSTMPGDAQRQLINMLVTVVTGTAAGLLISAAARTTDQASTLVPIVLIPQILLAGILVRDLSKLPDTIAHVAVSGFWVNRAMESTIAKSGDAGEALLVLAVQTVVLLASAVFILMRRGAHQE